jgi:hypothetical protein
MAFPLDYTLLRKIPLNQAAITGSNDSFSGLITEAAFKLSKSFIFANVDDGGGDVRFSTDKAGANQIPIDLVSWDKTAETCQVWWIADDVSDTSPTDLYIWGDNTGDTQPVFSSTFGRNAVWSLMRYYSHDGLTDSTGNSTITQFGSPSAGVNQNGGASVILNGSNQYGRASTSKVANAVGTISAWIKPTTLSNQESPLGLYDASSAVNWENLGSDTSNGAAYWMRYGDSYTDIPETVTTLTLGEWQEVTGIAASTTDRRVYINAADEGSSTTLKSGLGFTLDRISYGRRDDSTPGSYFHGEVSEMLVCDDELSTSYISTRNSNIGDVPSFYLEPEDVSGGITLTADIEISKPVFSIESSVTLPVLVSDAQIEIQKPVFSSSVDVTLPNPVSTIAATISKPSFSGSVNVTLPSSASDVDILINAPIFSAATSVTLPQPDSAAEITIIKPEFSASVTVTDKATTSSITFDIDKPVFSTKGSVTLPQPVSDIQFNISKPVFSVMTTVSGLDIIVGDNAKITVNFKSNKLTLKAKPNSIKV